MTPPIQQGHDASSLHDPCHVECLARTSQHVSCTDAWAHQGSSFWRLEKRGGWRGEREAGEDGSHRWTWCEGAELQSESKSTVFLRQFVFGRGMFGDISWFVRLFLFDAPGQHLLAPGEATRSMESSTGRCPAAQSTMRAKDANLQQGRFLC